MVTGGLIHTERKLEPEGCLRLVANGKITKSSDN